jgi:hypothetical protein
MTNKGGYMKTAFDCAPVKCVTAWALSYEGQQAGKLVASHGQSQVICTIAAWKGPLSRFSKMTGRASGYGYHKLSAAMEAALESAGFYMTHDSLSGRGESCMKEFFEKMGYQVLDVI